MNYGVMPIPDDISFELAASYQMAYGTSYHALVQRGEISNQDDDPCFRRFWWCRSSCFRYS